MNYMESGGFEDFRDSFIELKFSKSKILEGTAKSNPLSYAY